MNSPIADYLDGKYPQYSKNLFADDLVFSISSKISNTSNVCIRLAPRLYDEMCDELRIRLMSIVGSGIEIVKDSDVSIEEGVRIDIKKISSQYEDFNKFLLENYPDTQCSKKDFKLINLFEKFIEFRSKI